MRISVGIPDICEFRAIVFTCECAGEKGPTRERRASQKPKSLTLQKFCPDFTTDLLFCAILWICLPNFAPPQTLRLQLLS